MRYFYRVDIKDVSGDPHALGVIATSRANAESAAKLHVELPDDSTSTDNITAFSTVQRVDVEGD